MAKFGILKHASIKTIMALMIFTFVSLYTYISLSNCKCNNKGPINISRFILEIENKI